MDAAQNSAGPVMRELMIATTVAGAAQLARSSDYQAAERLLKEIAQEDDPRAEVLDLQARISSQRGRLDEAERSWRQLLDVEPHNEAARAALSRLARMRRNPTHSYLLRRWVPLLAFGLLLALLIGFSLRRLSNLERQVATSIEDSRGTMAELSQLGEHIRHSREGVEELSRRLEHMLSFSADNLERLMGRLDIPGVQALLEGNELALRFAVGLFVNGIELHPEAGPLLTRLGHQLEPHSDEIFIQVIGFTDDKLLRDGSEFTDNTSLGLARATAVVEHLLQTTRLPVQALSARAGGHQPAPYPNDDHVGRARNRTVVIRVSG